MLRMPTQACQASARKATKLSAFIHGAAKIAAQRS